MPTKAALFRNIHRTISQIVVCGCPQMKSPPIPAFKRSLLEKLLYLSRSRDLVYYHFKKNEKNRPVGRYEHLKPSRARNMLTTSDHLSDLRDRAILYAKTLKSQREQLAPFEFWYPYGSINNFDVLNALLTGENRNIFRDTAPKRAADIGAADGDVSFFMEREGWEMTIIDNPPTNWNGLRGAKLFKEATGSRVQILEIDLDSQFLLKDKYDVVFFMGILYHLKNPFYVLEQLSKSARYAFLSTRIMRWSKPPPEEEPINLVSGRPAAPRQLMEDLPVAYLLGPTECNNDSTNYWIFSDAGLRRILDRTGWDIEDYLIIGETENADPFSGKNDARSFSLIKSRRFEN